MTVSSMVSVWASVARERPDDPAVTIGDEPSINWRALHSRTNRLARLYAAHGVKKDDIVTICLPTGVAAVEAIMAVLKLGATPNPISSKLPIAERDGIVELARPSLFVSPPEIAATGVASVIADPDLAGFDDSDLPEVVSSSYKAPTSGGSTGRPKIILAGSAAVIDDDDKGLLRTLGLPVDSCCLFAGPIYHNTAVFGIINGLSLRNHVVLEERFDAELTLRLIERHRVAFTIFVPTMMNRIWRLPENVRNSYDLSSLKMIMHNAAPCPPALKQNWLDWVGPERLYENYTATELSALALCSGGEWLERPGTVGRAIWGEFEIRHDDGSRCAPDEIGMIWMRRPEGAPQTFTYIGEKAIDRDDRWETVGDLGHMDPDGYLFLSDRRKDLIISGGANIYPAEVEAALSEYPNVVESVVIGLPDEDLGQTVHAIVHCAKPGIDLDDLRTFMRGRLLGYKCPRSYEIAQEALRDDAGKVRRSALLAERSAP